MLNTQCYTIDFEFNKIEYFGFTKATESTIYCEKLKSYDISLVNDEVTIRNYNEYSYDCSCELALTKAVPILSKIETREAHSFFNKKEIKQIQLRLKHLQNESLIIIDQSRFQETIKNRWYLNGRHHREDGPAIEYAKKVC